mmetsp:Transcript_120476/g.335405  ORF Transcript_120476/g.335405 Transcript_120476/m.335405 type:complete len:212 (+) Transcript_120476:415-1050(+)
MRPRVGRRHPRDVADFHGVAPGKNGLGCPPAELERVVLQLVREDSAALRLQVAPPRVGDLRVVLVQRLHAHQPLVVTGVGHLAINLCPHDHLHRRALRLVLGLGVARHDDLPVAVGAGGDHGLLFLLLERVGIRHLAGWGFHVQDHLGEVLVDARGLLAQLHRRVDVVLVVVVRRILGRLVHAPEVDLRAVPLVENQLACDLGHNDIPRVN